MGKRMSFCIFFGKSFLGNKNRVFVGVFWEV